jgi:DNA-binding SARP family transcriptional activator
LSLSLLGPFQATLDGQPITDFRANKVRALLAYLSAEAGRPHPRTVLAELLWPDRPERAALASLRNALAMLRRAIRDREAMPPFLLVTRETIRLNPAGDCWLDMAAFQELVETAEADGPVAQRLEEAVALYRGDLLQGFAVRGSPDFEDWALLLRDRLQRQVLGALRRLMVHYERGGEVARACEVAWRQVELAPWEEEAHRELMRLLALSGQRGTALAQYEACRRALAEELGVEPGEETVTLYERIRAGEIEFSIPGRELGMPPRSLAFLEREEARERFPRPVFVAREGQLECMDGSMEAALAGQGRVVFITGEAGTGKTALVGEFARRAQARHAGLIVAAGNCNAFTGTGDPYLPFREILGQLTGDVESRWEAGALSTEGARRLWALIPLAVQLLVETGPDLIDTLLAASRLAARAATAAPRGADWREQLEMLTTTDRAERGRAGIRQVDLYAQYAALLTALAQHHPLLLTVDDLQWGDADSIELLFHLGRRLEGSRVLIVGIYRRAEVALGRDGERHPLAPVIHEFERQFGPIQVDLPQAGDRQFVESYLDSEPNRLGHGFRQALYHRTGGHALCTVEMVRAMQERQALVQDESGRWVEGSAVDWASLPAQCEGVIGERIDRLPAVVRETLKVASVEGETFTAEVVAEVRGAAEYEIVAQLSGELDRRHQLVASEGSRPVSPGGPRTSRYRFRHILFQDYLYNDLDEAERAYLHEAVGTALEQLHAGQTDAIAVQLARHFYTSARMDKAADYSLQAGDRARGLYAYAEARQHYARALEALDQLPDTEGTRRRRVDALIAQVSSSLRADSPGRNLTRLTEAERLARGLAVPNERLGRERLARVHFWMGFAHYVGGEYREGIRYCQQVLPAGAVGGA